MSNLCKSGIDTTDEIVRVRKHFDYFKQTNPFAFFNGKEIILFSKFGVYVEAEISNCKRTRFCLSVIITSIIAKMDYGLFSSFVINA